MEFSESAKLDFSDALKYFAQIVTDFLLSSAENIKNQPILTF